MSYHVTVFILCDTHTESTGIDGHSPLYWAIYKDRTEVERHLREYGCTVDDGDKDRLLVGACKAGRLDVMKELIEDHNCDPTSKQ